MSKKSFEKAETKRISLSDHVLTKVKLPLDVVDECVNIFFREIVSGLAAGESVKLAGFGTFLIREKKSRIGRNPITKQEYDISARKSVAFKTSTKIKKLLNSIE